MILLTGTSGATGRHLPQTLITAGEPVRIVTRGTPLPGVVQQVPGRPATPLATWVAGHQDAC